MTGAAHPRRSCQITGQHRAGTHLRTLIRRSPHADHRSLILSQAPRLDEPAQVTLVVTSTLDAPGTTAEILLPPGAVATGGALTWTGDLQAQQPQQLQATIKFTQEGDWTLQGKALRPAGGRDVWGDLAVIYLHVTREAGQAGFLKEPNAPHTGGQASPTITATTPSKEALMTGPPTKTHLESRRSTTQLLRRLLIHRDESHTPS